MPKYLYKCESCEKDYVEIRDINDSQFITKCDVCGSNFIEQ